MADAPIPKALRSYWEVKYLILLTSLLVVLLLPVIPDRLVVVPLFRITFIGVLLASILTTARNRRIMVVSCCLAAVGELSFPLALGYAHAAKILFFFLVSFTVLQDVMKAEEVTLDKIRGAICGYILLAVGFAIVYKFIDEVHANSFSVADLEFHDVIYFSFTTISTLGYGDIVPMSKAVKALTSIEALIGQFYIAVVVARLVSLYLVNQTSTPDQEN